MRKLKVMCMAAGILAAAPAYAETMRTEGPMPMDPLMWYADSMIPRNQFVLTSDQDVELIRFKTPRDVELCAAKPDPGQVGGTHRAFPLRITWDDQSAVIQPGNCMHFDAKSLKVASAVPIPQSLELVGTYRVKR